MHTGNLARNGQSFFKDVSTNWEKSALLFLLGEKRGGMGAFYLQSDMNSILRQTIVH